VLRKKRYRIKNQHGPTLRAWINFYDGDNGPVARLKNRQLSQAEFPTAECSPEIEPNRACTLPKLLFVAHQDAGPQNTLQQPQPSLGKVPSPKLPLSRIRGKNDW
jgi:hypothetical protein